MRGSRLVRSSQWLITGSSGYLGSALVGKLLELNETSLVLLDINDFCISHPSFIAYQGDIGDEKLLKRVFQEQSIDGVVHLAASKSVVESFKNPEFYLQNNFIKSKILFEIASSSNVKKFVFASSAAVYSGDQPGQMVTELSMTNPRSPYGRSKLLAEEFFKSANSTEMETTSLRFFNLSGFNSFNVQNFGAINTILSCAMQDKTFSINQSKTTGISSLGAIRDYIDIDDAIDSLISVMKEPYRGGFEKFNVSTGVGTSLEEVINRVELITKKKLRRSISQGNFEEIHYMVGDPSSFENRFSMKPRRNLDEIILNMYHRNFSGS
jgi:UDP-glucose 4-epimerase